MNYHYDLFVIGGGSGGVRTANRAAMMGKKVAIAEQSRMGGTCVVRGCIPKKLYFYAADFAEQFTQAKNFGWNVEGINFNWQTLVKNKEAEITRLQSLYESGLQKNKVEIFRGTAKLHSANEININGKIKSAKHIVVAAGGTPNVMAGLAGAEHCIVSDQAFDLQQLPNSIIIYGGGYIAVEFAGIFNSLGVDTTLIYRGEKILRGFDEDLREILTQEYQTAGIKILTNVEIKKVALAGNVRQVMLSNGEQLQAEKVLLAAGRLPLSDNLNLAAAGVEVDEKNYIKVDNFSRTSVPSISAIGDITNRIQLTPVAIHEAMCFVASEYGGKKTSPDYEMVASAVYSHPEIGTVGLSESAAIKKHADVDIYKTHFRPLKHTLSNAKTKVFAKLIVESKGQKIVGCHLLGAGADEWIQLLAISLKMGATKKHFDATMAVHPTACEELVTMYEPTYKIRNRKKI